jgi:hypothetical protein
VTAGFADTALQIGIVSFGSLDTMLPPPCCLFIHLAMSAIIEASVGLRIHAKWQQKQQQRDYFEKWFHV